MYVPVLLLDCINKEQNTIGSSSSPNSITLSSSLAGRRPAGEPGKLDSVMEFG